MGRSLLPSGHLQGNHERLCRKPLYELEEQPRFVQGFSCRGLRYCGLCRRFTRVLVPEVSREGSGLFYNGPASLAIQWHGAMSQKAKPSAARQWKPKILQNFMSLQLPNLHNISLNLSNILKLSIPCIFLTVMISLIYQVLITKHVLLCILLLLTAIGLSPGGSDYSTCTQIWKKVTKKFKSGGLHERHVVATWKLGNHLSIRL